jgi:PAS domain S-box-containing protein
VAALYEKASADEQTGWRNLLTAHREQLFEWAENYPPTFGHKHALVLAELARLEGRDLDAMRLYEEAIRAARENGFVQNEGVANELAAQFYLKRGIEKVAHSYLRDARYCYLRWGALGKVKQLDERYPAIEEQAAVRPTTTIGTSGEQLDLGTVMKASQAVAGEIVLEQLIETLMVIAVEHAGAERGLLILPHGGEHRIAAEARTGRDGVEVQLQHALVTPSDLPDSLLRYVIRTQESVILDDASVQNLFLEDEYVRQQRPRSTLCLPLVKQAKLMGVLYLENSLAPRVFTPKRLAMLELLASQAAISLDHARLYAELTQENSDRRKAEEALRASEGRWRKLFENSSAGIALVTPDGRYTAANLALQKMLGYTEEELQRLSPLELTHEEDRAGTEAILAEAAEGQQRDYRIEKRYRRKDGNVIWADVSSTLVPATGSTPAFFAAAVVDITERKRAEEMRAAMAREREIFAKKRATEQAKANEALRGCLDALASVPELDNFLGQVMATITRQLGAVSSSLRILNVEQNTLTLELVFQGGRVMSPAEASYPESSRSLSPDEQRVATLPDQPTRVIHILDRHSPIAEAQRSYLLGLGIKTLLVIPLSSGGQVNGQLDFRFTEERDFNPEELEIARALAIQASLAIQLTRLAKTARQSGVLQERNRLAGEIHDSLAQSFVGISMHLDVAEVGTIVPDGDDSDRSRDARGPLELCWASYAK